MSIENVGIPQAVAPLRKTQSDLNTAYSNVMNAPNQANLMSFLAVMARQKLTGAVIFTNMAREHDCRRKILESL